MDSYASLIQHLIYNGERMLGVLTNDYIYSSNVDDSSNVYLTGSTISGTGLISSNSFQNSYGGGSSDGFIFKFDSSGQMKWNSYYGGSSQDWGQSITTDNNFNIYLSIYIFI